MRVAGDARVSNATTSHCAQDAEQRNIEHRLAYMISSARTLAQMGLGGSWSWY